MLQQTIGIRRTAREYTRLHRELTAGLGDPMTKYYRSDAESAVFAAYDTKLRALARRAGFATISALDHKVQDYLASRVTARQRWRATLLAAREAAEYQAEVEASFDDIPF